MGIDYKELKQRIRENRQRVIIAFSKLRKQGILTRANYMCCGNCGAHGLFNLYEKMEPSKKKGIKGCAFWHHQDEEAIPSGVLYIRYFAIGDNVNDINDKAIGLIITKQFAQEGLSYEWDLDPSKAIMVKLDEKNSRV